MAYQKVYMNQIHSSSLLCQLAQMWRGEVLCDAFIRTGNITTKAHRVVLVAACPMLQSMDGAAIGSQLEVKLSADIKKDSVIAFLQYLYEGFMMLSEDNVRDVEKISRLLQVDGVTKCCSDFHRLLKKVTGRQVASDAQLRYTYADQAEFKHVRTSDMLRSMQNGAEKRGFDSDESGRKKMRSGADDSSFMYSSYSDSHRSSYQAQGRTRQKHFVEDSFELVQTDLDTTPGSQGRPVSGRPSSAVSVTVASQINPDPDVQIVSLPETSDFKRTSSVASSGSRHLTSPFTPSSANKTASSFNFGGSVSSPGRRMGPGSGSAAKSSRHPSVTSVQEGGQSSVFPVGAPKEVRASPSVPSPSQTPKSTSSSVSDDGRSKDSEHAENIVIHPMSLEPTSISSSPTLELGKPPNLISMMESESQGVSSSPSRKETSKERPSSTVTSGSALEELSENSGMADTPDLSVVKIEKVSEAESYPSTSMHHTEHETGGLEMHVDIPPGMEDYAQMEGEVDDDGSDIEIYGADYPGKMEGDQGNSWYLQTLKDLQQGGADGGAAMGMGPGGSGQGPGMSPLMSRQSAGRGLQIDYANYGLIPGSKGSTPNRYRSKMTCRERTLKALCMSKSPIEYLRPLQRKIGSMKIDELREELLSLQNDGFGVLGLKKETHSLLHRDAFLKPAPENLSEDDPFLQAVNFPLHLYTENFNDLSELSYEEVVMLRSTHPDEEAMRKLCSAEAQIEKQMYEHKARVTPDEQLLMSEANRLKSSLFATGNGGSFTRPAVPSAADFNPFSHQPTGTSHQAAFPQHNRNQREPLNPLEFLEDSKLNLNSNQDSR